MGVADAFGGEWGLTSLPVSGAESLRTLPLGISPSASSPSDTCKRNLTPSVVSLRFKIGLRSPSLSLSHLGERFRIGVGDITPTPIR